MDTTPEGLTEDSLMEKSTFKPVTEKKWTLDSLAERRTAFDFFYYIDSSMTWAMKLKQTVEGWYCIEKFLEEL